MLLDKLYDAVEPITRNLGYILWGIEILGSDKITVVIYIDHKDGILIGDCEIVSKEASAIFDVEDIVSNKYVLEVSSPGFNRRIFSIAQAQGLVGLNVKAVTSSVIDSQTKFKGLLEKVEGNNIVLKLDDDRKISFSFDELKRLRLSPEF